MLWPSLKVTPVAGSETLSLRVASVVELTHVTGSNTFPEVIPVTSTDICRWKWNHAVTGSDTTHQKVSLKVSLRHQNFGIFKSVTHRIFLRSSKKKYRCPPLGFPTETFFTLDFPSFHKCNSFGFPQCWQNDYFPFWCFRNQLFLHLHKYGNGKNLMDFWYDL